MNERSRIGTESRRIILHSDMNCFYASVEMMLDPSLRGRAVAVCGSTENRHGIVLAKSQKAKEAGIKTGMVNWEARRRCPDLIIVPPQYSQYVKYSRLAQAIYQSYTDQVEPYGMDECWLDVTRRTGVCGSGMDSARMISRRRKEELGLTVSIGVSFNKRFAKLGSDLRKPDAITEIPEERFREIVWPLPAENLLFVGRSTRRKLEEYGITTIGQIAEAPPGFLHQLLGVNGLALKAAAMGEDYSPVTHRDFQAPIKSVGHGITCYADLNTEEVWKVMLELSQDIGHRLRIYGLRAGGVQISIRESELGFRQHQGMLPMTTQSPSEIADRAFQLFKESYHWVMPVRAVTVRAISLSPVGMPEQAETFTDLHHAIRQDEVDNCVEQIRERFGKGAIRPASLMGDLKMPFDGRDLVRMPGHVN